MNKIKDIIYDKSDILIAILILAMAALIILWRLGIILEYPKEIIGTDDPTNVLTEPTGDEEQDAGEATTDDSGEATETGDSGDAAETGDSGEATTDDSGDNAETGDSEETSDQGEATTDDEGDKEAAPSKTAQWDGKKLSQDLEVTITGTTASEAVQCLVDAGVYSDYADYQNVCKENGWDHEKMKAGVFTFKKGETKKDITRAVNWS